MFDFFISIGSAIMAPLYFVTSAILVGWHWVFEQAFGSDSGWTWALSIVGLTLTIRFALIPLFVKQIKTSRNMQLVQPQVKELQKKYGHDRERLAQETMKLYQETGTNPFASCLPLLLQMPIFLALFRLLDSAAKQGGDYEKFALTSDLSASLKDAVFLGAQIAQTFISEGADSGVRGLAAALVIAMTATTFLTQRQLMRKNMPADALTGPYAQQQKILLYVLPLAFGFGGIFFPIGVLLYWTTSNLWTMGQQFYVIRRNPAPGTPAFRAKQERDARHGRTPAPSPADPAAAEQAPAVVRQQPRKQSRSQRSSRSTPGAPAVPVVGSPNGSKAVDAAAEAEPDSTPPPAAPVSGTSQAGAPPAKKRTTSTGATAARPSGKGRSKPRSRR